MKTDCITLGSICGVLTSARDALVIAITIYDREFKATEVARFQRRLHNIAELAGYRLVPITESEKETEHAVAA